MQLLKVLFALASLTLGGMIYVIYRNDNLLMFNWFQECELDEIVAWLRTNCGRYSIRAWVNYNLPAGLWLLSYLLIIDTLWSNENSPMYWAFILYLPIIAIFSEVLQVLHCIPGTFDLRDVLCYLSTIIFFVIIKILNQ